MITGRNQFSLLVSDDVASVLKNLHPTIKMYIRTGLQEILVNPYSGKALKEELQGLRSYRIKRYRIIYRVRPKKKQIEIIAVGPRKCIYEETFRLLDNEPL